MPNTIHNPRSQTVQVVKPVQNVIQPNRDLENKMDRMMFGALTRPQLCFGTE